MSTAVLDTNVLASGFVRPEPAPGQLLAAWGARRYTLIISEHILAELGRTFEEPYFRRHLTPAQRANNLALLRQEATFTAITVTVRGVATHPEDNVVLATAVSATAEYLITRDRKLQRLATYAGVTILSPRAFLDVLTARPSE